MHDMEQESHDADQTLTLIHQLIHDYYYNIVEYNEEEPIIETWWMAEDGGELGDNGTISIWYTPIEVYLP